MIATVCDAQNSAGVCTSWEHMLITSVVNSNTLAVTRGFSGTAAASHAVGRSVSALIDAVHQKVLSSAVKSIEAALGPNLSNIPTPLVSSAAYNFTPQTPGGSLIVGSNVVSLAPCPKGVSGTDTNHYVYISGGTGTAEAGLITGGTCTSGATSGTVILSVSNTHSGAWTIQSATSGVQEAICGSPQFSTITVASSSTLTLHQTLTVPGGYSLQGGGIYLSTFSVDQGTWPAVNVTGVAELSGVTLNSVGTSSAGTTHQGVGIAFSNVGNSPPNPRIHDIWINGFATGVASTNSIVEAKNVMAFGVSSVGFLVSGGAGIASLLGDKLQVSGWGPTAGGTGYKYMGTVPGSLIVNSNVTQIGTGFSVYPSSGPVNEIQMDNIQIDGTSVGFDIEGGRVAGGIIGQLWVLNNFKFQGTNQAIIVHSGYQGLLISNWSGYTGNSDWATIYGALSVRFVGCSIYSTIPGANAHAAIDIVADTDGSAASDIEILGSHVGGDAAGGLASYFNYGVYTDASAMGSVRVAGSWVHGAAAPLNLNGTGGAGIVYSASGNDLYSGLSLGGGAILNGAGGSATVSLNGNTFGGELGVATVASIAANTITLPASQVNTVIVSADGSGGVATVTAPNGTQWIGRTVRIIATHANGIVFNTSGNIRAAKTLTVGQSTTAMWDGAKWNLN
jgi:hypothetical protein